MDIDQLVSALSDHDADPTRVLIAMNDKRYRGRRNRRIALAGVLLAAVAAVGFGVTRIDSLRPSTPSTADGCAVTALKQTFADARQGGASIILAKGTLTGRTATDGETLRAMTLDRVETLAGPAITSGDEAWIRTGRGSDGPLPSADAGSLLSPDGSLFAIAWPAERIGTPVGPVLRMAPVVGNDVIFSSAGCWDVSGLSARPFHGRLDQPPGTDSYKKASGAGLWAVPLSTVSSLARP